MPFSHDLPFLTRIVTTTQFRGIANLLTDADPVGAVPKSEGPAVIVHGLSNSIPGLPNHFITLLEAGGSISVARMGAHMAQIEIIAGKCQLSCKKAQNHHPVHSYISVTGTEVSIDSILLMPMHPGTSAHAGPASTNVFPVAQFPKDDANVLYIESTEGVALLYVTRDMNSMGHDHAKMAMSFETSSSSSSPICTNRCIAGCPQHALVAGLPAPNQ